MAAKVQTWLVFGDADCPTCGWKMDGKNAMGLAAQHAKRTGHTATCRLEYYCQSANFDGVSQRPVTEAAAEEAALSRQFPR